MKALSADFTEDPLCDPLASSPRPAPLRTAVRQALRTRRDAPPTQLLEAGRRRGLGVWLFIRRP
jgi:hypothetical protein